MSKPQTEELQQEYLQENENALTIVYLTLITKLCAQLNDVIIKFSYERPTKSFFPESDTDSNLYLNH